MDLYISVVCKQDRLHIRNWRYTLDDNLEVYQCNPLYMNKKVSRLSLYIPNMGHKAMECNDLLVVVWRSAEEELKFLF